jgi:hypothetical protein
MARGRTRRTIYTRVIRIQLTEAQRGLLPFFEQLDRLPRGRRSDALLQALQHGLAQGVDTLLQRHAESARVERAIENILDGI